VDRVLLCAASEGQYGESGIEVFQMEAAKRNICIAVQEKGTPMMLFAWNNPGKYNFLGLKVTHYNIGYDLLPRFFIVLSNSQIYKGGYIFFYFLSTFFNTLHLPPLGMHCVGGCWDRTQNCCDFALALAVKRSSF
jgi:hypothetical protein